MWPFKRRKTKSLNTDLPPEVQEYYRSEQRERVGVAWLIAFVSLLVSVVVIVGAYFGGRWVYRKIAGGTTTKKPSNTTSQKTTETKTDQPASDSNPLPNPSNNSSSGQSVPVTPNTPNPSSPSNNNLLRTGPDEDL